jgi:hypothetical protein
LKEWVLKKEGDYVVMVKSFKFNSPSAAADILLGRASNWWTEWKNKEGKTLDEVYRKG